MAKLVVCTFEHSHGADACVYAVPNSWTDMKAEAFVRREMEQEYGKEQIAIDTEEHGGICFHHFIKDGTKFECKGKRYHVHIEEV